MTKNLQPIEKATNRPEELDVHSIFRTIQGEGPFSGHRAVFLRLAGCNLQCPWCDTEYTQGRKTWKVEKLVQEIYDISREGNNTPTSLVVITGGEPFRQNLTELLDRLTKEGFFVQIESNGSLPPAKRVGGYNLKVFTPYRGVYLVISPKTGKINQEAEDRACAFKYVLEDGKIDKEDGLPVTALGHTASPRVARPPKGRNGAPVVPVYIQPMDEKDTVRNYRNMKAVVASSLKFGYIAQMQVHKNFGVE